MFQATLNEETETYMEEIARQVTMEMNERVDGNLENLQSGAMTIEAMGARTPDEFTNYLQSESKRFGYTWLSLANTNGIAISSAGSNYHVSNRPTIWRHSGAKPPYRRFSPPA